MTDEPTDTEPTMEQFVSVVAESRDGPLTLDGRRLLMRYVADLRAALARSEAELAAAKETVRWMSEETLADRARVAGLREAAVALLEQIEVEIGPCDGSENSSLWPSANGMRTALDTTDESAEAIMAALRAVDAAFQHDNTNTGTCPDCADQDAPCDRAMELWPVAYAALAALRERGMLIAPTPDPVDTAP